MSEGKSLIDVVEEFELMLQRIRKQVRHAEEMHPREAAEQIDRIHDLFAQTFAMVLKGDHDGAVKKIVTAFLEEEKT